MRSRAAMLAIIALACSLPVLSGQAPSGSEPLSAVTRPSGDVTLSFVHPGRVTEILADVGVAVKAGQLVSKQDDSEEQKQLESTKADAEDTTEIEAETTVEAADKHSLQNLEQSKVASVTEIDDARLKVDVDAARIKLAIFKRKQNQYKYESSLAGIDKFHLKTPIDGVVAETMIHVGEVTDGQNMKVMRVVQLDPLWLEVEVPVAQARQLKPADPAQVYFADSDKKTRPGKVALIFPVGNSGSSTIKVRVEVPNPEKLQSGENVQVTFGPSSVAATPH